LDGAYTINKVHPVSVSAPGGAIIGVISSTFQVMNQPTTYLEASPGAATYAVDYELGVIVFSSGVSGTAPSGGNQGLITTAVTASYSYVTNMDNVVAYAGGNVAAFTPITQAQILASAGMTDMSSYLDTVVRTTSLTAATLASPQNWSRPNLVLMGEQPAHLMETARIFAPLFSPTSVKLYPTPDMYAEAYGLHYARHNSIWSPGHRRGLVGRRGATKYGVGIPTQISGPYPNYSGGGIVSNDLFYLEEYSVIGTPLPTDPNGNTYNPPFRSFCFRGPNG
jgi:hypothetical protein